MKNDAPLSVLFVNMVNPARDIENLYPPLGPAYLAAFVHKYISRDKIQFRLISNDFETTINKTRPDIVGITCVSQNYGSVEDHDK
jgi:hypothetical protein